MRGLLLSGGMDSVALAYWLRPEVAFTIDYGQAAAPAELRAADRVSAELGIRHEVVAVDCSSLGSGDMAVSAPLGIAPAPDWWPYRNQLLVTLASMRALSLGVTTLIVGSVAGDDSHADGRREFYVVLDALMRLQEGGLRVEAPALGMDTVALVRASGAPRELMAWAHSCHVGPLACGSCRGCVKHFEVTEALYDDAW